MASAPGNLGALLWDQAVQGSDHNRSAYQPPMIPGGPEGVVYGPAGYMCCDEDGVLWRKRTDISLNTGWCEIIDTCNLLEFQRNQ